MSDRPGIPDISTAALHLSVVSGEPYTITHGFGRQVVGWLVLWQTAACDFVVQNPLADTRQQITLIPSATADVRLVLL